MPLAVNKAGDAVYWDGQNWSPATVAANKDTGARVAWDGSDWQPLAAPEQDNAVQAFGKGLATAVPAAKEAAGGLQRGAGEAGPLTSDNPALAGDQSLPEPSEDLKAAYKASAEHGAQIYKAAAEDIAKNAPHVAPGEHQSLAYQVGAAIAQIAPIVGVTALTRDPELGVELTANLIGAEAYGEKYGEARDSGRTQTQASFDAGFTGLTQSALARVPLGVLMKPGGSFLAKSLHTAGAAAFQNAVTTALQEGYDKGIVGEDMPLGEAVKNVIDAGIVGAVSGGILGAGEHGIERLTARRGAPPETPQAPPGATQPPTPPSPEAAAAPVLAAPTVDAAIKAAQDSLAEPIDIEAMGRAAIMQAEANAAPMNADRGLNDLLGDLDMQEGQIQQEAGEQPAQPQPGAEAQPEPAVTPPQEEGAPLPMAAAGEPPVEPEVNTPSLADTTTLQGRVRGAPRRVTTGPVDAATFLALEGGIRNDEGHDLVAGRGLQQFVPGAGPLIRPGGMSIDYAGEALHQAGYFGPPDATPRPTENEVLQYLERMGREPVTDAASGKVVQRPVKLYTPEDQAQIDAEAQAKRVTEDNARALQDVHDEAHALGETLEPHEADQIVAAMGERGIDPLSAVVEHLERKALQEQNEDHEQTGEARYAESVPEPGTEGKADRGIGAGEPGQEAVTGHPSGEGEEGHAAPESPEAVRALGDEGDPSFARRTPVQHDENTGFDFERGAALDGQGKPVDQFINEAGAHSAKQLAAAREAQGHGKIAPKTAQRGAGPLFGEEPESKEPEQKTLFARREEEIAPPFFSALTRAVEGLKMEKAPPGQWEATIKNQPGVKAEELDWSGLNDWLRRQTKSVTKAEVLQHLRENEVHVREVEHSDSASQIRLENAEKALVEHLTQNEHFDRQGAQRYALDAARGELSAGQLRLQSPEARDLAQVLQEAYEAREAGNGARRTKYGSYTLPGGKNYRELLLTLPHEQAPLTYPEPVNELPEGYHVSYDRTAEPAYRYSVIPPGQVHGRPFGGRGWESAEVAAREAVRQINYDRNERAADEWRKANERGVYKSSHWDEPNVLAHVRFDDRTGPNGEKILHVAEVQSDWHQAGRRRGYQGELPKYRTDIRPDEIKITGREHDWRGESPDGRVALVGKGTEPTEAGAREYLARYLNTVSAENLRRVQLENSDKVPEAPFKSSWQELAMKRMLRYAAEHGYDRVTWDTGDTNAERYDLSKRISKITAEPEEAGRFLITAYDHKGANVLERTVKDANEAADIIGKDAAEKLFSGENKERMDAGIAAKLEALDLKVGGEGMRAFYDRILPQFTAKYVKKWGAKVEAGKVGSPVEAPTHKVEQNRSGEYEVRRRDNNEVVAKYDFPGLAYAEARRLHSLERKTSTADVHSVAITPAMRESVMRGQPMFARERGEGSGKVVGIWTPEFDALRDRVMTTLRQRLDALGLHDIALKLPDQILADGSNVDGAYKLKIIGLALDAKDWTGVLDHEAVHAMRDLGLFTNGEWSILARKAAQEWRARYKIDERYGDFSEDKRNEEAVAEAFRYWRKGMGNQKGLIASVFNKVRNTLSAIGNALRGNGFATAESIFGKVGRGEIGARPREGEAADAMFARRNPPTEDEIYRDGVANLIQAASGGDIGGDTGARLLTKVAEAGIRQIKNVNPLELGGESGWWGTLFPRTLASLDDMSARLWRPWMAREEEGHATTEKLRRVISDSLVTLSPESRDRVYAALELARKWEWRPPDDGRPIRVRNTSYWQARKSKVGDDYVLNAAETRAFHDALKLGDEGWRTFMGAIARREGWKGTPDPEAIRKAANEKGEGLPEGKRLLRLADTIEAAQGAMNRPYFPAMRFGDYYIAVKPKIGTEENSLGGYPKVEWFETVEKPVMHDLLGKSRVAAADMPEVKEAIQRIKALTKADGSPAFTDATHDFEVGDLRSKPNILRQLNLPAVEKLFMLMERGVKDSLRDKIMATNTTEEGATGKDAARIKREAGEAAEEHYEATLGAAKDTLLDAVYHDLLSGWKKHAQMVPGYSADFDRAIGTHLYQVGRNAADIIYRNDIEDAYQNIQDNHPHASTKQYWSHWRQYQESPQSPLSRAAGKTAQLGAAYVMGLNPSTTMMIGAHTPLMATPVLGVGGGMGQATAQMSRAIREVYKELTFDKKKGGFIDTSKLGRTDREKAMLADLEKAGLTHSLGADDVRALNDRQAGLWGQAQPTMKKAMDIAMSNVSAVDQANRNAIALATHRMAMNPATLEKMAAPWMEHSAVFRQMVMSEGLTPENFTKFMMSEAAGAWGRTNQAPAMRGTEGSLMFALHGFQTRFLSTAWKLMFNMGPAGKVAAGWMMAALWAGTGIYGLPFTQDLENVASYLWKKLTGSDPMIDAHLRQFLQDAGLGKIGTEVLLRGPLSVMTGIDLGSRLGFGDVLTRSFTASDLLGTVPTIIMDRLGAAYDRARTGQGIASAATELLPSALRNPVRARIEAGTGEVSRLGNMQRTPENIGRTDTIMRSLGLPSLAATEARDRAEYVRDLGERDKTIHEQTRDAWAEMMVRANRAQADGDYALAHELSDEASQLLQSYNTAHWQTPLDEKSLGDAMLSHTAPEIYHLMKTPGRLRGEAYRNPY